MGHKIENILVVEDDMIIQMFLNMIIKNAGFKVVGEARTCEEVLKMATELKPDLILMDIGLAGDKDGVETAKLLNKSQNIPIIFITGNSDEATIARAQKANPIDFIFKPINENSLRNKLLKFKEID